MGKEITPQERKAKELGYKFYKFLLHATTIFCLWRMYVGFTTEDEWEWIYVLCFILLLLKHGEVALIKRMANDEDMLETEWLEKEREKKKNKSNNS